MYNLSILMVEDDEVMAEVICLYLQQEGYEVSVCKSAEQAWELIEHNPPSLLLCDVNLPGETGFELVKKYREQYPAGIIIFLTGNSNLSEKLKGFQVGADDYITKPFMIDELLARIKAQLRKERPQQLEKEEKLKIGNLIIDLKTKAVYKNGKKIELFTKEKKLLFFLASNYGRVYSAESLLELVWGYETESDLKTIVVHISNLRKKIEDDPKNPKYLQTIRGFGYKLFYEGS